MLKVMWNYMRMGGVTAEEFQNGKEVVVSDLKRKAMNTKLPWGVQTTLHTTLGTVGVPWNFH